jgi:hypothetical protein
MKLKDVTPGYYIKNGDIENFVEARDASDSPDSWFGKDCPKIDFFSMGWDCADRYQVYNDKDNFEPAMVITVKEYESLK